MKYIFALICFAFILNHSVYAAEFCIAPIDSSYHQYGQYGEYGVQVDQKNYSVSHTQAVKVTNVQINKNMQIRIKKQGQVMESFMLKLAPKERLCLAKSTMYPTWLVVEMRKNCRC